MKQSQAAMDLTRGRPLPQILRFSLPLVGGMVLQQMRRLIARFTDRFVFPLP